MAAAWHRAGDDKDREGEATDMDPRPSNGSPLQAATTFVWNTTTPSWLLLWPLNLPSPTICSPRVAQISAQKSFLSLCSSFNTLNKLFNILSFQFEYNPPSLFESKKFNLTWPLLAPFFHMPISPSLTGLRSVLRNCLGRSCIMVFALAVLSPGSCKAGFFFSLQSKLQCHCLKEEPSILKPLSPPPTLFWQSALFFISFTATIGFRISLTCLASGSSARMEASEHKNYVHPIQPCVPSA